MPTNATRRASIIQGSDERAKGEVTIKDLIEGAKAAAAIKDNKEWKAARPAQYAVAEANLVDEVKKLIARIRIKRRWPLNTRSLEELKRRRASHVGFHQSGL